MKNQQQTKMSYLFDENEKIGRILVCEGETKNDKPTIELYKVNESKTPICALNVHWADLDGVKREIEEHEDEILENMRVHRTRGYMQKIDELADIMATMCEMDKNEVRNLAKEKLGIK